MKKWTALPFRHLSTALLFIGRLPCAGALMYLLVFIFSPPPSVWAAPFATFYVPDEVYVQNLGGYTGSLNLDEYVAGVVAAEMGETFPFEALKAQAVAARTLALEQFNRTGIANGSQAFTASYTPDSPCRTAGLNTSKIVILYDGALIKAYSFPRCNGNKTLDSHNGLSCADSSCTACVLGGLGAGHLNYARSRPCSGHSSCAQLGQQPCCTVSITYDGTHHITGHGVGLCRQGALDFAGNSGMSWSDILTHFYTDITLANVPGFAMGTPIAAATALNVRPSACDTATLGTVPAGTTGIIVGGPQRPVCASASPYSYFTWWEVSYANGLRGWSVEHYLRRSGDSTYTLQAQIDAASPGATLSIPPGTYFENLSICKNITLQGSTTGSTIIDGNHFRRPLTVCTNVTVTLRELVLRNGNERNGGGIYNDGHLSLFRVMVTNNAGRSVWEYSGTCGGIRNNGYMTLDRCLIAENTGYGYGEGYYGGIHNSGSMYMTNSTIFRNDAEDFGGIYNEGVMSLFGCTIASNQTRFWAPVDNRGTMALTNCTISQNRSGDDEGAIRNRGTVCIDSCTILSNRSASSSVATLQGTLQIRNTIIAGNSSYSGSGRDCSGTIQSLGNNLIGDTNGCVLTGITSGNIYGQDPLVGPLQNNGGFTLTHALLPGSPALDAGSTGGLTTDQRGLPRPYDRSDIPNRNDGADIGAFELGGSAFFTVIEAESGIYSSPMHSYSDTRALGGHYIYSSVDNSGTATYRVSVPQTGLYVVWCRILADDPAYDSFFVSANGGTEDIYDMGEGRWTNVWQWTVVNGRNGTRIPLTLNPRLFNLHAGVNTLQFRTREPYSRLDALIVTSDLGFNPNAAAPMLVRLFVTQTRTVQLGAIGQVGEQYRVLRSSDLAQWLEVGRVQASADGSLTYQDTLGTSRSRFYRLEQVSSP